MDLGAHNTQPESILERRLVKKGNSAIPQVLTKWTGFPVDAATWEDLYVLKQRFRDAVAWGKAPAQAGGDVMAVATPRE